MSVGVQRIEGLDGHRDDDCQHQQDENIEHNECPMKCLMPAELGMRGSDNPLSEYEVGEEQDEDSSVNEDHRSYGDFHIVWVTSPDNSHDAGDVSSHAEAEH